MFRALSPTPLFPSTSEEISPLPRSARAAPGAPPCGFPWNAELAALKSWPPPVLPLLRHRSALRRSPTPSIACCVPASRRRLCLANRIIPQVHYRRPWGPPSSLLPLLLHWSTCVGVQHFHSSLVKREDLYPHVFKKLLHPWPPIAEGSVFTSCLGGDPFCVESARSLEPHNFFYSICWKEPIWNIDNQHLWLSMNSLIAAGYKQRAK